MNYESISYLFCATLFYYLISATKVINSRYLFYHTPIYYST